MIPISNSHSHEPSEPQPPDPKKRKAAFTDSLDHSTQNSSPLPLSERKIEALSPSLVPSENSPEKPEGLELRAAGQGEEESMELFYQELGFLKRFLLQPAAIQEEILQKDETVKKRLRVIALNREIHKVEHRSKAMIYRFLFSESPSIRSMVSEMLPFYGDNPPQDSLGRTLFANAVVQGEFEVAKKLMKDNSQLVELIEPGLATDKELKQAYLFFEELFKDGLPEELFYDLLNVLINQKESLEVSVGHLFRAIKLIAIKTDLSNFAFDEEDDCLFVFARDVLFSSAKEQELDREFLEALDKIRLLYLPDENTKTLECKNIEAKPSLAPFLMEAKARYPVDLLERIREKMARIHSTHSLSIKIPISEDLLAELATLKDELPYEYYEELYRSRTCKHREYVSAALREKMALEKMEAGHFDFTLEPLLFRSLAERLFTENRLDRLLQIAPMLSDLYENSSIEKFFYSLYLDKDHRVYDLEFSGESLLTHLMLQKGLKGILELPSENREIVHIQRVVEEIVAIFPDLLIAATLEREEMYGYLGTFIERKVRALPDGSFIAFPLGLKAHAMYLLFEKGKDGFLEATVYNTGYGLEALGQKSGSKEQTFCTFEKISPERLDFSWFCTLTPLENEPSDLYAFFDAIGEKKEFPSPHPEDRESVQINQSCSVQCIMAFYRHRVMKKTEGSKLQKLGAYKYFKLLLQKQLLTHRKPGYSEVAERAFEDVKKRLDLEQELFLIAQSESKRAMLLQKLPQQNRALESSGVSAFEAFALFLKEAAPINHESGQIPGLDSEHPLHLLARLKLQRARST